MRSFALELMPLIVRRPEPAIIPQWLPRPLNIFRADLKGKWLAEENLRFADARLANLQGADLYAARLRSADLRGVTGLTLAQLQGAQTNADTQLPADLR